jgi:hypothetical protein
VRAFFRVERDMAEIPNLPKSTEGSEEIRFPACERVAFEQIFYNPNGKLRGGILDCFYLVGRDTVERIISGQTPEDMEGVAALYLFRHYLELALKSIVYCLRRLETGQRNRPEEDRRNVEPLHPLTQFWNEIKNDCLSKVGRAVWRAWDIALVDKCVSEFDSVDPEGERFRYSNEKRYGVILRWGDHFIEVRCHKGHKFEYEWDWKSESADVFFTCMRCRDEAEQRASKEGRIFEEEQAGKFKVRDRLNPLGVSWTVLLKVMEQTHNVLEAIDSYLVETYSENEEWQEEMNSW